jgi:DNA-binding response OmpR family regulator
MESDPALCVQVERHLRERSYRVHAVMHRRQGLRMIYKLRPDLIIVGDDSPAEVLSTCQEIRRFISEVPLVLLVPPGESVRLRGLTLGADECLQRDLDVAEVSRTVGLLLNKGVSEATLLKQRQVIDRHLTVDLDERRVILNGEERTLSPTEARLLASLLLRRGRTIPYRTLVAEVWGSDQVDRMHSLKFYIWNLRQKIELTPSAPRYILTVRRRGYRFR